ncbi:MAG: hypothetical protein IT384_29300 [Deltaproteobacteria bacterium]|nr:hypothetical protein [Deltaproteobacteria bacterium]
MIPRAHRLLLLPLWAFAACSVEPPFVPDTPDATVPPRRDSGVAADGGISDGGTADCRSAPSQCPANQSCARDGRCRAPSARCIGTRECVAPEICLTTTGTVGRCGADPDDCAGSADCAAHQRCLPASACAPLLDDEGGTFAERCSRDLDCGPDGLCRGGRCVDCSDESPCPGELECFLGFCLEALSCARDTQCYLGNRCVSGSCTRSAAGCTIDPENDAPSTAQALAERRSAFAICGEDVDWYRFEVPEGSGARLIARADPAVMTLSADLLDLEAALAGDEIVPSTVRSLGFTGVAVFEVSTSTGTQSLALRVQSADSSGPYVVELEQLPGWCAGDAFDLYGDRTTDEAVLLPANVELDLIACPGDVDRFKLDVLRSDRWSVGVESPGNGVLLPAVLGPAGQTLASGSSTLARTLPLAPPVPAGDERWSVVVSAFRAPTTGEPYTLELSRQLGPRIEACANPTVVSAGGTFDLDGARDLGAPDCSLIASEAVDRVFRIDPPRAGAVLYAAVRQTRGATTALAVGVVSSCADDGGARACDATAQRGFGAAVETVATSTAPLFLIVSADPVPSLEFQLQVAFDDPGNYTCRLGGAQPILSSGQLSVSTDAATNTVEVTRDGACGGGGSAGDATGPDRFFALSLGARQRAVLELIGPVGGFLWAGTGCATMTESCAAADDVGFGDPAKMILEPTTATNFLVAVDGVSALDAGRFQLRTILSPACLADTECQTMSQPMRRCDEYACTDPPANDRCDGTLVALGGGRATIVGSTGAASDDLAASCGGGGQQDVVYAFAVPSGQRRISARVSRAVWDPVLSLRRGSCATVVSEVACNDDPRPDPNLPATTPLPEILWEPAGGVPADRYYLLVDAYRGAGSFEIELRVEP